MPNLNIFTSNRLEILAEILAELLQHPLPSPLTPEIIVVQSRGMERWISMELARCNGICANVSFLFPDAFLNDVFRKFVPDYPETSPFNPGVMTFRIMGMLPSFLEKTGFNSLRSYLEDDFHGRKLYQLSERISDTFDQYLVFRPDMVFQWESGKANHWQAQLWRALIKGYENQHRAWLYKRAVNILKDHITKAPQLPERVSVFGISYLPPEYLYGLAIMSRHIEMNFFLMNPSKEYWADIVTRREITKISEKYISFGDHSVNRPLHLDQGNRLIASMGMMGRDFFDLVYGLDAHVDDRFEDSETGDRLLACIQSDILNLEDRTTSLKPFYLQDEDTSVQIHSCHSPMREIEILHDHLLALFEENPDLLPKDILVLAPDIETYAPYIHAVFDSQSDDAARFPYSVADHGVVSESQVISGFLSLLDMKDTRITSARVMNLLENAVIREKFEFSEADLEAVRHWVRNTNIRWGIDAENRRRMGLTDLPQNTWQAGIQRMLLGYVLPGGNRRLYEGMLPYDDIEGDDGIVLGKFLDFLDRLFLTIENLDHARNIDAWHKILNEILELFFLSNATADRDFQLVRQVLNILDQDARIAEFEIPVDFDAIRAWLDRQFKKQNKAYGFLSGGITFCAMLPMRSIPVKVVCLIGMNSGDFPRQSTTLAFDFISRYPMRGDRSRRNDDKYLFLESILSARNCLYISYVGQSIQDNSRMPPSPLVSELLDYIMDGFQAPESRIVTVHRLQAFSPRYFKEDDRRLFSYSRDDLLAAASLHIRESPRPFVLEKLTEPPEDWKYITVEELVSFFRHPAKYFLEKRNGIFIREKNVTLDETENFALDGLETYSMGQNLLHTIRSGEDLQFHGQVQKAAGDLPLGKVGDVVYRDVGVDANQFAKKIGGLVESDRIESREVSFQSAGFYLTGHLGDLYKTGQVRIRYGKNNTKDLLTAWVYHLILNKEQQSDLPNHTLLICKDSSWELKPVDKCNEIIDNLLRLYWEGLCAPLHFFPDSSYAFADAVINKQREAPAALTAARMKWLKNEFDKGPAGESEDSYNQLCFRGVDPLDQDFQKISLDVFSPVFEHLSEIFDPASY